MKILFPISLFKSDYRKFFIGLPLKQFCMRQTIKFLILGILFFLITNYFTFSLSSFFYGGANLVSWFIIPIVIAVGMLKGPKIGLIFGLSSIFPFFFYMFFAAGYTLLIVFLMGLISSFTTGLFGYIPIKRYNERNSRGSFFKSFIGVALLTLLLEFLGLVFQIGYHLF